MAHRATGRPGRRPHRPARHAGQPLHRGRRLFWVALPSPRDWRLDLLQGTPGIVRSALWALPDRLRPALIRTTWVMAADWDGRLVHDLQDSTPGFCLVTGVRARGNALYLRSLRGQAIAITTLPGVDTVSL